MAKINVYLKLMRFDRPIGTLLLLWPTLIALFLASGGTPKPITMLVFVLGVFLTRSAGCVINDFADIEFDKHVARTQKRPLTSHQISKLDAILFAFFLCCSAFIIALIFLKTLTILMSIFALFLFVLYPFTKRFFAYPQLFLGLAFSFGILMAYVEVANTLSLSAWLLFIANTFWVFGYDTIYALIDKADDLKIGIKTSAISLGEQVLYALIFAYSMFILLIGIIGKINHLGDLFWLSLVIASVLLLLQTNVVKNKIEKKYLAMFLLNNWVGFVLFVGIFLSLKSLP